MYTSILNENTHTHIIKMCILVFIAITVFIVKCKFDVVESALRA